MIRANGNLFHQYESDIEDIIVNKVLSVLVNSNQIITPKQPHYDSLEVDEFWTYVGNKKNKVWLIYAFHCAVGKIVSCVLANAIVKLQKRKHKGN